MLVKRWAKDRGICHAAKGHLSPYLWGLLTIYFLQVRDGDEDGEGALLPALDQFEMSESLAAKTTAGASKVRTWKSTETTESKKSVGGLFKEFVHFFESSFDWRNEAVSIRAGRRAPPSLELPLHIIVSENSTASQVGPSIEDPFHAAQNLGDGMNTMSFARLKEELSRATALCNSEASLSELLEPWAPPADFDTPEPNHDDERGNGSQMPAAPAAITTKVAEPKREERSLKAFPKSNDTEPKPEAAVKSNDWRRDAAEAQASAAARAPLAATPPWRRKAA